LDGRVIRVKSWKDFKRIIEKSQPNSIIYSIEQGVPSKNLTCLRIIIPIEGIQYTFIDMAKGDRLRETKIKLHRDKIGNLYIRDEDVKELLKRELNIKDSKISAYWTI